MSPLSPFARRFFSALSESGALKRDAEANGGYMSFSLFARHVSTKEKVDLYAWKVSTFYAFISYHIKASKGHIQSRMRTKADDWLGLLAKAKAAPPPRSSPRPSDFRGNKDSVVYSIPKAVSLSRCLVYELVFQGETRRNHS